MARMANPSLAQIADAWFTSPVRCGATRVLLIDGPAGAGKTTLAARIATHLGATASPGAGADGGSPIPSTGPQTLHGDDLYEGWGGLATLWDTLGEQVLVPLSEERDAGFQRWDWLASKRGDRIEVPMRDTLIVEGVGVAQRAARPYASLIIWVEAPWEVRRGRGLARDGEAMATEWDAWHEAELAHFAAEGTKEAAGLVIDGRLPLGDEDLP